MKDLGQLVTGSVRPPASAVGPKSVRQVNEMIEYICIEIRPKPSFGKEVREFRMEVRRSNGPSAATSRICESDELSSHFDLLFDVAKNEILKHLKAGE